MPRAEQPRGAEDEPEGHLPRRGAPDPVHVSSEFQFQFQVRSRLPHCSLGTWNLQHLNPHRHAPRPPRPRLGLEHPRARRRRRTCSTRRRPGSTPSAGTSRGRSASSRTRGSTCSRPPRRGRCRCRRSAGRCRIAISPRPASASPAASAACPSSSTPGWNAVKWSGTSGPSSFATQLRQLASAPRRESFSPGISSVVSSNQTFVSRFR